MAGKPKAPSGCFWKGNVIWGRYRPAGAKAIKWSLKTDNPAIARKRYEAEKTRLIERLAFGASNYTWDEAVEQWASDMESAVSSNAVSPKTVVRYACSLDSVAPFLEGKALADVNGVLLGDIVAKRKDDGATHATIKRDLTAISSVFNYCCGRDWIETNPVLAFLAKNKKTNLIRERRAKLTLIRLTDLELVKAQAKSEGLLHWPELIETARLTGARESELLTLQAEKIDHVRKQLTLTGKRSKTRTIELYDAGYAVINSVPRHLTNPRVFWAIDSKMLRHFHKRFHDLVRRTKRHATKSGWEADHGIFVRFRFHDLRHLHAFEYLKNGLGQIRDLQIRMGHASVTTTEEYLRADRAGWFSDVEIGRLLHGAPAAPPVPALRVVEGGAA